MSASVADLTTAAERARPHLISEVARISALLEGYAKGRSPLTRRSLDHGPLTTIGEQLGLSSYERDVLLLTAAVELDGDVASLVARLQGGDDPRPTFALAMNVLPDPHWDAIAPHRPLRRWGLLELGPGATLVSRPLRIDEYVLHDITGIGQPGAALESARVPYNTDALTEAHLQVTDELVATAQAIPGRLLVRLVGDDLEARSGVADLLARLLGRSPLFVGEETTAGSDLIRVARLVDRDVILHGSLPILRSDLLAPLLEAPLVVVINGEPGHGDRTELGRSLNLPDSREQARAWHDALQRATPSRRKTVAAVVPELAHHYRLPLRTISAVATEWALLPPADEPGQALRRLTRERARVSLGTLAERIEPRARWDDLVLPDGQRLVLTSLAQQVRHRGRVYDDWGFARMSNRGLGVTALFAGESGTGKTMAAEVLAVELGLDLYRIDLSAVVSKYIGETEKNLSRLFAAAEQSGAVLLFDEADALFGKRSDVKDSHDRYANLEVAYLLQRMEAYRGLAILTTNLQTNLDEAFTRRLRVIVQFPFPDQAHRERIWSRAFPASTPTSGLDPSMLARLHVSGGSIRSIALGAAFAAADDDSAVTPEHVLQAAKVEYAKASRTLTEGEVSGLAGTRP